MLYGHAYPCSDLYALGATCICLLTQMHPVFLFDSLETRWLWQERLQEQGKSISPELVQLLDKFLKEKPKERYQSAEEVLTALNYQKVAGTSSQQSQSTTKSVSKTIISTPQQNPVKATIPKLQLQYFDFEVVTLTVVNKPVLFGTKSTIETNSSRKQGQFFAEDLGGGVTLEMVSIPGGTFMMGSPESEGNDDERP